MENSGKIQEMVKILHSISLFSHFFAQKIASIKPEAEECRHAKVSIQSRLPPLNELEAILPSGALPFQLLAQTTRDL